MNTNLIKIFICLIISTLSTAAIALPYSIENLGAFNVNFSDSLYLNNNNQVVGSSYYYNNNIRTDLNELSTSASQHRLLSINNSGVAVGIALLNPDLAEYGQHRGFIYDGHNIQYLDVLGGQFAQSMALDINDAGQVVGRSSCTSNGSDTSSCAFIYENGVMTDLMASLDPTNPTQISSATNINNNGLIIGDSNAVTTIIGGVGDVSELLIDNQPVSVTDLNDLGDITGSLAFKDSFLFRDDTLSLISIIGAEKTSTSSLNNNATVVGSYDVPSGLFEPEYGLPLFISNAFIYTDEEGALDLYDLVDGESLGWDSFLIASDINDLGNIVGIGEIDGVRQAFMLTPVPVPAAIYLFTTGILGLFGFIRIKKNK